MVVSCYECIIYFLEWWPIVDGWPLCQLKRYNIFLWVCWFLGKNLSNFISLPRKHDNPYYQNPGIHFPVWLQKKMAQEFVECLVIKSGRNAWYLLIWILYSKYKRLENKRKLFTNRMCSHQTKLVWNHLFFWQLWKKNVFCTFLM